MMRYQITLTMPGADPVVSEGDLGTPFDPAVAIKMVLSRFLLTHGDLDWAHTALSRLTIDFFGPES